MTAHTSAEFELTLPEPADIAAPTGPGLLVLLLSVVDAFPSGGDRLILELVRRWPSQGGPITVLTTRTGAQHVLDLGVVGLRIRSLSVAGSNVQWVSWAYLIRALAAPFVVWAIMRRSHPGLVLSSSPFPPDLVPSLIARAFGARWIHSWQLAIPAPHWGYQPAGRADTRRRMLLRTFAGTARHAASFASQNLSLRLARRWCNKLLVPTQLMASEALAHGFDRDQLLIANYGIDIAEVQVAIANGADARSDTYDGIFVGRFHVQKGLDDLLAVWRRVQETLPSARLGVVGSGTSWHALTFRRQLGDFANRTVSHLGVLTGKDKYAAMSKSAVFLFPSHYESWGHVVLEAMAVGLPVVGYDLPSSREAFGDAVLYVPAFDVEAFADAVVRCLRNEGTRETYRARGLETAKKYDWNVIAHRFAQTVLA